MNTNKVCQGRAPTNNKNGCLGADYIGNRLFGVDACAYRPKLTNYIKSHTSTLKQKCTIYVHGFFTYLQSDGDERFANAA